MVVCGLGQGPEKYKYAMSPFTPHVLFQSFLYKPYHSFSGSPSLSGSATVTVLVDDVNDMVPLFSSTSYHTSISENAPTGSDVMLVNASDGDVGQNGVIRYCAHNLYS